MKVLCPKCGRPVAGEDIELSANRALCKPCGEIFPLPPAVVALAGPSAVLAEVPLPSDLEWSERKEGAGMTRTTQYILAPPRLAALPLLVFAGIWDSFIVFFYVGMMRSSRTPGFALLFPLLHVAAGVFITWLALVKTLNRSRVTFDRTTFRLEHSPIPARGASFPTSEIERFEATESRSNRGSSTWTLRVLTRDGKATRLSLPIDQRDHVAFVGAKLNAALAEVREPSAYRDAGYG
jgi:hypothetical protein